jgi:hypothetical protein
MKLISKFNEQTVLLAKFGESVDSVPQVSSLQMYVDSEHKLYDYTAIISKHNLSCGGSE